jgi:hypothetical protein
MTNYYFKFYTISKCIPACERLFSLVGLAGNNAVGHSISDAGCVLCDCNSTLEAPLKISLRHLSGKQTI